MAAIDGNSLLPPTTSDNETSDIEYENDDDDDCHSRRLIRLKGQHRKVTDVIEHKVWEIEDLLEVAGDLGLHEVHHMIKTAEEKERKRRMSAPYNATVDITDVEWFHRSRRLSDVHEELVRLFSVHKAIYVTTCEQQRRIVEAKKKILHEQLLRHFTRIAVVKAVEDERHRKIKVLTEMAEGKGDDLPEIADVNSKLVYVHNELKDAFKKIWDKEEYELFGNTSIKNGSANIETDEDKTRHMNIENAKRLMSMEQTRRMTEKLSDGEFSEKMQIVERLFPLHKQLRKKLGTL